MGMFWVFDIKGGVVVALNTKNASHRTHFACSCEPGLEGMHRVWVSTSRRGDVGVWLVKTKKKEEFWVYLVHLPPSMRLTHRVPSYGCICDMGCCRKGRW